MGKWYEAVPKDTVHENLHYRAQIAVEAERNQAFQQKMLDACREDFLFWINAFCWLFEPRARAGADGKRQDTIIPFMSWEHQDPILITLMESPSMVDPMTGEIGRDVIIEKSRGEGFSWDAITVMLHQTIFRKDMVSYGMVSKSEKDGDSPTNPDSLFWKIDWQMKMLPMWMVHPKDWKRKTSDHSLTNLKTNSSITSFSATDNVATGGRKTAFFFDEAHKFPASSDRKAFSSTEPVTDCRWIGSTPSPRGPEGAFYDAVKMPSSAIKLQSHWSDNKQRNRGLYTLVPEPESATEDEGLRRLDLGLVVDGKTYTHGYPVAVDPTNNPLPKGYAGHFMRELKPKLLGRGFTDNLEEKGKLRSPWYDSRCLRPGMTPRFIAMEYDINYGGSASRFFSVSMLDKLIALAPDPTMIGNLTFGEDLNGSFMNHDDGKLFLWFTLDEISMRPPEKRYAIAADVATGKTGDGSSNSTFSIGEIATGKKVGSFASPGILPVDHARLGIALAKWFHNAKLGWEANGPGETFGGEVSAQGYQNIYYRTNELDKFAPEATSKPGWWSSPRSKRRAFGDLAKCYDQGLFSNPDRWSLEEAKQYQEFPGGSIQHVSARMCEDPSGAGDNHGDRVIADMLLCKMMNLNTDSPEVSERKESLLNAPANTAQGRRNEYLADQRKKKETEAVDVLKDLSG